MLQVVNDLREAGKGLPLKTRLPKSFLALLVSSLKDYGVEVTNIIDMKGAHKIVTSHGTVEMKGSFSVLDVKHRLWNEIYGALNERFDKRVLQLREKGCRYYKKHTCFAKSERSAEIGSGIPNAAIMHMDDFMFNMTLERL